MWRTVFTEWERITLPDLVERFGIDAYDLDALSIHGQPADRPWRWLRAQIIALLDNAETRLARALQK